MKKLGMMSHQLHSDAHRHFAWMRQHAPVYRVGVRPFLDGYLVSRYADVKALLTDPRLVKDPKNIPGSGRKRAMWIPARMRPLLQNMLTTDNPQHQRLRKLVQQAFTPKIIEGMEGRIEVVARQLLASMRGQTRLDLVPHYALPLPVRVIAELVGVPDEDLDDFQRWCHKILAPPSPLNLLKAYRTMGTFLDYIKDLAEKRRHEPREDLMTGLVQAEADEGKLSAEELVAMVFLLLSAGHETTVGLLTNGTRALLQHPEQMQRLRAEPQLLDVAIEELLRYDGPLMTTEVYYAAEDIAVADQHIPKAAPVFLGLLSANRDEEVFDAPQRLMLDRDPNPHLAFGRGVHFCLGASLARLEAKVAFRILLEGTRELQLAVAPETLRYTNAWILNKLVALPVSLSYAS